MDGPLWKWGAADLADAGDAAALASGMTPLGNRNDCGGSLRIPSQFCGTAVVPLPRRRASHRRARRNHHSHRSGLLNPAGPPWNVGRSQLGGRLKSRPTRSEPTRGLASGEPNEGGPLPG